MCTLVILRRPSHPWPLLLAAHRDERLDRPWDPPDTWWPDRLGLIGGRDRSAGGTWMALGAGGVVAAVLNRPGSLGPSPDKRSRGVLPLIAASESDAAAAIGALMRLDAGEWRPFNLVVADRRDAFFLRGLGAGHAEVQALGVGISMVTAHDPNDQGSPRTRRHLPRFRAAPPPDPGSGDWQSWEDLLADGGFDPAIGVAETLRVPPTNGFGTVCSSLLAFAADGRRIWRFSDGPAGTSPFRDLALP